MLSSSTRPYLVRAIHQWCSDSSLTPHMTVIVPSPLPSGMHLPFQYVKDQQIILNISFDATRDLVLGNDYVTFTARFSGVVHEVHVPVATIISIFAKETNEGIRFEYDSSLLPEPQPPLPPRPSGPPKLSRVK